MSKKEKIIELLEKGLSYNEIARIVDCSKSTISHHARKLSPAKRAQWKYYDWQEVQKYHDAGHGMVECVNHFGFSEATWTYAIKRGDIKSHSAVRPIEHLLVSDRKQTGRANLKLRLLKEGLLKRECALCGIKDWMGKPLAFDLDHINGVNDDNRLENLRILCPNCHSQTETHAGKNRIFKKTKNRLIDKDEA